MFFKNEICTNLCYFITDTEGVLQLKERLQLLTLGIGGVGVVSAYVSYTPEIAARYAFSWTS